MWPQVIENDDGLRPAGPPDECFYCQQKIGQPHGRECVVVLKDIELEVLCGDVVVGRYARDVPYFWDLANIDFYFNHGSWCADNCLDEVDWQDTPAAEEVRKRIKDLGDECCCGLLAFRYTRTVKDGPYQRPPYKGDGQ